MKKIMLMGSPLIIGQIHFACTLAGLTVAQVIPGELIGKLEAYHQKPFELELVPDPFSGHGANEVTKQNLKEAAKQLMAYGSMVNSAMEHERLYGYTIPPNVPKQIGWPMRAKTKQVTINRKCLPCNRKS